MMKINKGHNLKIVALIMVSLFLSNSLIYAYPVYYEKETLRVPINDYERMKEVLESCSILKEAMETAVDVFITARQKVSPLAQLDMDFIALLEDMFKDPEFYDIVIEVKSRLDKVKSQDDLIRETKNKLQTITDARVAKVTRVDSKTPFGIIAQIFAYAFQLWSIPVELGLEDHGHLDRPNERKEIIDGLYRISIFGMAYSKMDSRFAKEKRSFVTLSDKILPLILVGIGEETLYIKEKIKAAFKTMETHSELYEDFRVMVQEIVEKALELKGQALMDEADKICATSSESKIQKIKEALKDPNGFYRLFLNKTISIDTLDLIVRPVRKGSLEQYKDIQENIYNAIVLSRAYNALELDLPSLRDRFHSGADLTGL